MWRQTALGRFKDYSLNKKIFKNASKTKQPSVPAYAGTGGCNKWTDSIYTPVYFSKQII